MSDRQYHVGDTVWIRGGRKRDIWSAYRRYPPFAMELLIVDIIRCSIASDTDSSQDMHWIDYVVEVVPRCRIKHTLVGNWRSRTQIGSVTYPPIPEFHATEGACLATLDALPPKPIPEGIGIVPDPRPTSL